jgi:translation initiation factor 3 subunit E
MATSSSDLTSTLGKYMDRHLFLPLLDFLKTKGTYPPAEMERAKLEVLFKTNMVDLAMDIYKELHSSSTVPETMNARRAEVVGLMTELQEEVQPILELVQDQGKVLELRNEKLFNAAYLQQQFQITPGHIDALHRYAKFVYDTGNYDQAVSLLGHYRALTTNLDKGFSAMWGQLASAILTNNFDGALELLNALKEQIDNRPSTPQVAQLQQRSWLMHWALFLLGNHPSGKTIVADLFFQDKYLNALQTNCAHLLRYLAVAVVTNPRRRGLLKELVRTIGLERHQHSDAVTLFLEDLYVRCDFEAAQARLADCAKLLDSDFFLSNQEEEFLKHARLHIFETYCRIHERIDLASLGQKLGMEQIAAEKWIVKMVSDAQLDAKIDSQSGHVILGSEPPDVYQQIIEKTKGLALRSAILASHIQKGAIPSA